MGEIKSVDFFIGGTPVDLKVTYFPNQYMDEQLKERLGKKEVSWMRAKAKEMGISYDKQLTDAGTIYVLTEKFMERGYADIIQQLRDVRKSIVREAQQNPERLMRWLYEHQGEMRFGAENRLFVILVDTADMSQSWKMKRAFSLIEPQIVQYLDAFNETVLKEISFSFKKEQYHSLADALFIVKE